MMIRYSGSENNAMLLRHAELDLSTTQQDLEALRRMRCCRWGYGFHTHRKATVHGASLHAGKLIWC